MVDGCRLRGKMDGRSDKEFFYNAKVVKRGQDVAKETLEIRERTQGVGCYAHRPVE